MAPVGPQTVMVNNTTVINRTVHITSVKMVNRAVFNEGPRTKDVERMSGRKLQPMSVRELRHREETQAVVRRRALPPASEQIIHSPANREPAPARPVPQRELRQPEKPKAVIRQPQPPAMRNQNRVTGQKNPPFHSTVPQTGNSVQNQNQREMDTRRPKPVANPAPVRQPQTRQEVKPAPAISPRVIVPVPRQPEARPQVRTPTTRNRPAASQPTTHPRVVRKGAQVLVEKMSKPPKGKPAVSKQRGTTIVPGADRKQGKETNVRGLRPARSQNPSRN